MSPTNLKSFLEILKREGELHIIDETIDPHLELAEIQRRTVARQGSALLFTRVARTKFPVTTNLFGTSKRIELAFGEDPSNFVRRLAQAAEQLMPPSLSKLWEFRDLCRTAFRLGTTTRRTGPVLEKSISPTNLQMLPQLKSWPADGGPFFTLPLIYTEDPATGAGNLGMYRNQVHDAQTLGMHFQIHRGIGFHYHVAEQLNQPLPAHLFLGGPPSLIMAAVAPLPENVPELILASLLQGGRIGIIRDSSISPLPIIAEADFFLYGEMPPKIRRLEGPFGDHYGYYSQAHEYPVFQVRGIFHRRNAIFPATVVGRPRQEDHYIGEYLQDLFSPIFPIVMNGVQAVWAYDDAGVHPLASAIVKERYRRESFMAALRILGEGQLSLTKFLLVTDAAIPLKHFRRLLVHILERADFSSDLYIFSNVSQDTLDYTTPTINMGSKAILMGLGEKRYDLPAKPTSDLRDAKFTKQIVFAPGVLVVEGPAWHERDSIVADLLNEPAIERFRLVCLVDDAEDCVSDEASFLWTVFTRFEPAADIHAKTHNVERYHIGLSAPILMDCRIKPWYPPVVETDPKTIKRVDDLWPKLF